MHLSKAEQKQRFLSRITDADRNWKFAAGDLKERILWEDYQKAYQQAISATSTQDSPWYVVPADKKWYTRLVVAAIIHEALKDMRLEFPVPDKSTLLGLAEHKKALENER